jgi:hypothetical protein
VGKSINRRRKKLRKEAKAVPSREATWLRREEWLAALPREDGFDYRVGDLLHGVVAASTIEQLVDADRSRVGVGRILTPTR